MEDPRFDSGRTFFLSHGRDVANMAKDVRRLPIKRRSKTISTIPTILTLSVNHILNATTAVNKTRDAESEEKAFQLSDRFIVCACCDGIKRLGKEVNP